MNTKLWHLGIASAIAATMGVAQAQSTPSAANPAETSPASGAIIHSSEPTQFQTPSSSGMPSDGVPGIAAPSPSSSDMSSRDWNNSQDLNQQPSADVSSAIPPDSLANVNERRNQGVQSNDGMNLPPAFDALPSNADQSGVYQR